MSNGTGPTNANNGNGRERNERRIIYCTCCGTEPMGYWFADRVYWFRKSHGKTHSAVYYFGSSGPPVPDPTIPFDEANIMKGPLDSGTVDSVATLTNNPEPCYPQGVVSGQESSSPQPPDDAPENIRLGVESESAPEPESLLESVTVPESDGSQSAPSDLGSLDPDG